MTSKKTWITYLWIIAIWAAPHLHGLILPWPELKSLCSRLELVGDNDLVVFDVDETLIISDDMVLRHPYATVRKEYKKKLEELCPEDKGHALLSQVLLQRKISPVEPEALRLIQLLQRRGVKIIALTAMSSGVHGDIQNLADWRFNELKKLGFDFSSSFPDVTGVSCEASNNRSSKPDFWKGILCSGNTSKGIVLKAFLEKLNWKPRRVIAVDDLIENLEMIEKEMHTMGIGVLGLHYTKTEHLLSPLDPAVVDLQFNHLIESGEWLSDGEAYRIIYEKQFSEESTDLVE